MPRSKTTPVDSPSAEHVLQELASIPPPTRPCRRRQAARVVQVGVEFRDDPCNGWSFNWRRRQGHLSDPEKPEQMPQRRMNAGAWAPTTATPTSKLPHRCFINRVERLMAPTQPAEEHLGSADVILDRVAGVTASVQIDEKSL
jgi:hypothetical protein